MYDDVSMNLRKSSSMEYYMNPLTLDFNLFFTSVLSKVYTNMMLGLNTLYEDAAQELNHLYLIRLR